MKMYNKEVKDFCLFMFSIELPARESRMRGRFLKIANERLETIDKERMDLLKQHCHLDSDGNPNVIMEDGNPIFDVKDRDGYLRDLSVLLNEEWVVDQTEERKDILLTIKNVILDYNGMLSGDKALQYDRWCEIVEGINY